MVTRGREIGRERERKRDEQGYLHKLVKQYTRLKPVTKGHKRINFYDPDNVLFTFDCGGSSLALHLSVSISHLALIQAASIHSCFSAIPLSPLPNLYTTGALKIACLPAYDNIQQKLLFKN